MSPAAHGAPAPPPQGVFVRMNRSVEELEPEGIAAAREKITRCSNGPSRSWAPTTAGAIPAGRVADIRKRRTDLLKRVPRIMRPSRAIRYRSEEHTSELQSRLQ